MPMDDGLRQAFDATQAAPMRFSSPYLPVGAACRWLIGNHHGHTTLSDGADDPLETLAAYEAAGYDYFAFSEHDRAVDLDVYRDRTSMTLLPAVEVTSASDQTLMFLGECPEQPPARALSLRDLSERARRAGALFIVNHPNWAFRPMTRHARVEEVLSAPDVSAIEIYTGVIERLPGDPLSVDVWDALLSAGRRVFGHATDDQHSAIDRFLGWNRVQWPAGEPVSAAGIVTALAAGRFVPSTGVEVAEIGVSPDGREIRVRSDARSIRWFVRDGRLALVTDGGDGRVTFEDLAASPRLFHPWRSFDDPTDMRYVRAEFVGADGARAWSQPFFLEAAPVEAQAPRRAAFA